MRGGVWFASSIRHSTSTWKSDLYQWIEFFVSRFIWNRWWIQTGVDGKEAIRRCFPDRIYRLTRKLLQKLESSRNQRRVRTITDADWKSRSGDLNCRWITRAYGIWLRYILRFSRLVVDNRNRDNILFRAGHFWMPIRRLRDLVSCYLTAPVEPVIKSAGCDIVFATPVSICHAAFACGIHW